MIWGVLEWAPATQGVVLHDAVEWYAGITKELTDGKNYRPLVMKFPLSVRSSSG